MANVCTLVCQRVSVVANWFKSEGANKFSAHVRNTMVCQCHSEFVLPKQIRCGMFFRNSGSVLQPFLLIIAAG